MVIRFPLSISHLLQDFCRCFLFFFFNLIVFVSFFVRDVNIFSGRSLGVSLAGVSPELNVIPTTLPTTPPPTKPPPTCGRSHPPLRNSSREDEARLDGSDYMAFHASAEVLNFTRTR